jgi:hypothetical protein
MAASVRVVLELDRLRELTYGGPMSSMLWRKGQAVLGHATAHAPVATGHYRASFGITYADTDRNVVRVYNTADYSLTVEYGSAGKRGRDASGRFTKATGGTTKHRVLGAALDAAGGS